eukprot:324654-Amphidinium_carterae.2
MASPSHWTSKGRNRACGRCTPLPSKIDCAKYFAIRTSNGGSMFDWPHVRAVTRLQVTSCPCWHIDRANPSSFAKFTNCCSRC